MGPSAANAPAAITTSSMLILSLMRDQEGLEKTTDSIEGGRNGMLSHLKFKVHFLHGNYQEMQRAGSPQEDSGLNQ